MKELNLYKTDREIFDDALMLAQEISTDLPRDWKAAAIQSAKMAWFGIDSMTGGGAKEDPTSPRSEDRAKYHIAMAIRELTGSNK